MRLPIHFRFFKSSGPGGQHRNKTMSAVEASVTLPDGRVIRATAQTDKSQHRNKRAARAILLGRVRVALQPETERRRTAGWGEAGRVRTYHEPDNRVTDHASGLTMSYRETVGRGDLAPMIESRWQTMIGR
jgi:protein subunit release factor A